MKLPKVEKQSGNYLKLDEGVTKLRILADPIVGQIYWVEGPNGNRPVRVAEELEEVPAEAVEDKYGNFVKRFWTFVVYNYEEKKIQIWEIVQTSIQDQLFRLNEDEDWGDLKQFDIKIERIEGNKVKYEVRPVNKADVSTEVANAYAANTPNLEALWKNEDPFGSKKN